ncbi:MAG: hypothetical protein RIS73_584, partial [Bacteroidota bacterium]
MNFIGYISKAQYLNLTLKTPTLQIETQNFSQVLALSKLSEAISRAPHLIDIYELALDALQHTINADKASVLLFDEMGYIDFVASRNLSEEYQKVAAGHCPWKQNAINPEPILVADAEADNTLAALLPVIKKEGITALGFIPLVHKDKLLGKFMIYFEKVHQFSEEEIQIAQIIARDVAFAIWEKKSAIALQKTVQELNEIIEHSIDTIFKLDTQGCILFISPEFYRAMEYNPEDLIGQHFKKIVFEDDLHICQAAFNELLQTKIPQRSIIYRSLNKNEQLRWFNTSVSIVCNDNGEPQYILGISKDITKITEADTKLKQAE